MAIRGDELNRSRGEWVELEVSFGVSEENHNKNEHTCGILEDQSDTQMLSTMQM